MITFHSFSDGGCKINFTYNGQPIKVKHSNDGLLFCWKESEL